MPSTDRKLTTAELSTRGPKGTARPLIRVVLEDVRSRHNVGSIFRSADAFGIAGIYLCGITPVPPHREIEKTALGATASVPWRHFPGALEAVEALKEEGYVVFAVEQTELALSLSGFTAESGGGIAVVFGNELHGVSPAMVEACDGCLAIPQRGIKHSLNVAVCAGIVLWSLSST